MEFPVEKCGFFENLFSKQECQKIIELFRKSPFGPATVYDRSLDKFIIKQKIRSVSRCSVPSDGSNRWIYAKLIDAAAQWSNTLKISPPKRFERDLEILRYSKGDHYVKHVDNCKYTQLNRQLSLVVQLNSNDHFSGGNLVIYSSNTVVPQSNGSVTLFSSYAKHQVTTVTQGERFTMVAWMY